MILRQNHRFLLLSKSYRRHGKRHSGPPNAELSAPQPSPDNLPELTAIAETASRVCGGAWSVDLLQTERGWFLTDMATAETSWHWEDCSRVNAQAAA